MTESEHDAMPVTAAEKNARMAESLGHLPQVEEELARADRRAAREERELLESMVIHLQSKGYTVTPPS